MMSIKNTALFTSTYQYGKKGLAEYHWTSHYIHSSTR